MTYDGRTSRQPATTAIVAGCVFFLAIGGGLLDRSARVAAQEPSGLAAAIALEEVLIRAIERSEKSVVSIARYRREEAAGREFRPELLPRPGVPFDPPANTPASPDFVPNDFATGVVIDEKGLIVTTRHAVEGPEDTELWVTTSARRPLRARIVGADPRSDLAVLKVTDASPDVTFTPITFGDASQLKKGQIVLALGNPYAIARDGRVSASWGIVANLSRKAAPNLATMDAGERKPTLHHFGTLIQTDAKLNLGTSGGALLNLKGEMIGLTTSQAAVAGFEQSAGYAVPVDDVFRRVVELLKQGKEVDYGLLGVSLRTLGAVEQAAGLHGVRVDGVLPGSPAMRADIRPGDVITNVGKNEVFDVDSLMLNVGRQAAAAETSLTIERDGQRLPKNVRLAKFEVRGKKVITAPDPGWRGATFDFPSAHREMNPQMFLAVRVVDPAVLVVEVEQDSPAWQAGLRRGMLVTHVQNTAVEIPADFYKLANAAKGQVELRIAALPGQPPLVRVPAP